MSYLRYLCLLHIVVSNTYFVVCLFRLSSSCVPYVVIFSGLSILDCSFGIHFFNNEHRFLNIDSTKWLHSNE